MMKVKSSVLLGLALFGVAVAQVVPITGALYGPVKVKEVLPPGLVVLESGHRLVLGGLELPHWGDERYLQGQARRRSYSLGTLRGRAQEAFACVSTLNGREVYLELEEVGGNYLAYLYTPQLRSHELLLDRPLFSYVGQSPYLDNLGYIWVRQGCAWATPQGKYASLFQEAQEKAKADGRGLWRP